MCLKCLPKLTNAHYMLAHWSCRLHLALKPTQKQPKITKFTFGNYFLFSNSSVWPCKDIDVLSTHKVHYQKTIYLKCITVHFDYFFLHCRTFSILRHFFLLLTDACWKVSFWKIKQKQKSADSREYFAELLHSNFVHIRLLAGSLVRWFVCNFNYTEAMAANLTKVSFTLLSGRCKFVALCIAIFLFFFLFLFM